MVFERKKALFQEGYLPIVKILAILIKTGIDKSPADSPEHGMGLQPQTQTGRLKVVSAW